MEYDSQSPKFALPVDSDHKATEFRIFSIDKPHMRAFHLAWFSYFSCFLTTFAAAPLLPIIRDNLNLTTTGIGKAGIASVSGAVFARIAMGTLSDLFGPRLASASLLLLTAPAVFLFSMASSPFSFLFLRFCVGISLANFVPTLFWMSSMFSPPVVGTANGFAGGWGNFGGGATQLIMPLVFGIIQHNVGAAKFTAWRIAFQIPAVFQMLSAIAILLFGQDMPDGNFHRLEKSGDKPKDKFSNVFWHGVKNYRGWILALTYGYCFGVELTVDNIIAEYFYDRFNLKLHTAGMIAATFGLANIVSRPTGGVLSDLMARRFGMRGRLWTLWVVQTLGGVFCVILGRVGSVKASIGVMILFSLCCQSACGLTFGVVPFVSRRSLGVISGMIGGGGSLGAVMTQLIFFKGSEYSKETGLTLMGVMIICCTLPLTLIYFPQWGGMLSAPSSINTGTEEEYYMSEWTSVEKEKGFHRASVKFAENSRSERGKSDSLTRTSDDIRPTGNSTCLSSLYYINC
ncbi:high affinity nitrate transporter 2.5-like [Rosa rugosa]|uniref:high affinity nitrate transporter 2.5-like n=1 Tax=Rosa rugosa TaxID=74645 RepID=UPI002B40948D|nr:high affinity nitrate transporter 2.5-like [Rosa rugosa]